MQLHYNVDYEIDGKKYTVIDIYSSDPGSAMAHVLRKNPDGKITKAWIEGYKGAGYQEWLAPPIQREPKLDPKPARALKPNERGCEFPFYDDVRRLSQK